MKRLIAISICLIVFCSSFISVNAIGIVANNEPILVSTSTEYLENGTKIETAVYEDPITTYASDYMKSGKKTVTATTNDDEILYTFTVSGVFSVDEGVSAICTSASYSTNIIHSYWSCVSASATKSGNQAIANGTFRTTRPGIPVETDNLRVVLTCDDLGNLS